MSGTDAIGGFAYQHAQAIQAALRLVEDPELERIRVEADNDVIDLEVWSHSGDLIDAHQYKRRNEQYTWGRQELIDELTDWSDLGANHAKATYRFVTDGRLGLTGRDVRDALKQAADGSLVELIALMTKAKRVIDISVVRRAEIVIDDVTYNMLFERAQAKARPLIPNVSGPAEADERSRWVVLELLHMVTDRSGQPDASRRFITKAEVLALLSTPQDRIPTQSWSADLKASFIASVLSDVNEGVIDLDSIPDRPGAAGEVDSLDGTRRMLESWVDNSSVCLLGGGTGTGKSTGLMRMQYRAAQQNNVILVADAEDYTPGRLAALIAAALNRHTHLGAHPSVGNAALKDRNVTIAIDGVSEIPADVLDALRAEIRALMAADAHASLLLAGRDTTTLRSVLTRNTNTTSVKMSPLDHTRRRTLVATALRVEPEVVADVVREVEQALGEVANNPMMLLLGLRTILLDGDATNPSRIFRTVVRAIASDNGYSNASQYEIGLGIAFSRLLDDGKRYTDTFGWITLLNDVAATLVSRGHRITADELREFGSETGLVNVTQLDSVRPLHDSFADYLAAAALEKSTVPLPDRLRAHDRARIRYLAGLSGVGDHLATQVTRDLPLTAVTVAPDERRRPDQASLADTQRYLDQLLPPSLSRPRIAYWTDSTARRIVTVGGDFEGWWDGPAPDSITNAGWSFPLAEWVGPLQVAVRIWQRQLSDILTPPKAIAKPVPQTRAQSAQLLSEFSDELHAVTSELVAAAGINGEESARLHELTQTRRQFLLGDSDGIDNERDRGVSFRDVPALSDGDQVLTGDGPPDTSWTGWGRVDSFLTQTPTQSAIRAIADTINDAVGRRWL